MVSQYWENQLAKFLSIHRKRKFHYQVIKVFRGVKRAQRNNFAAVGWVLLKRSRNLCVKNYPQRKIKSSWWSDLKICG